MYSKKGIVLYTKTHSHIGFNYCSNGCYFFRSSFSLRHSKHKPTTTTTKMENVCEWANYRFNILFCSVPFRFSLLSSISSCQKLAQKTLEICLCNVYRRQFIWNASLFHRIVETKKKKTENQTDKAINDLRNSKGNRFFLLVFWYLLWILSNRM